MNNIKNSEHLMNLSLDSMSIDDLHHEMNRKEYTDYLMSLPLEKRLYIYDYLQREMRRKEYLYHDLNNPQQVEFHELMIKHDMEFQLEMNKFNDANGFD